MYNDILHLEEIIREIKPVMVINNSEKEKKRQSSVPKLESVNGPGYKKELHWNYRDGFYSVDSD